MKLKSVLLIVATLVLSANIAKSQQQQPIRETKVSQSEASPANLIGRVTQHKGDTITVSTAGVRSISVDAVIDAQTKLLLNGTATSASMIVVGDSVIVKYLPLTARTVKAISVDAHRRRTGKLEAQLDPKSPAAVEVYPLCPDVGSGGTIPATKTPCYCRQCGGAGSGMVW